ncbi:hypothetical protein CYLTODRAFT_484309 [Cylindrobasidium torrendii FP15055 ss-10]|uniref:Uncharacterized protein n=1 Tax=Cylindrobasidium torrendii FP15055 ss-10 TaxID=1314674 RepID=A0A0D7BAQ2_9AGAR|nr:hypothetical protein CYLTODRAFT_484309 [Cylindrobasidium torrendii FP15055 ss-10]
MFRFIANYVDSGTEGRQVTIWKYSALAHILTEHANADGTARVPAKMIHAIAISKAEELALDVDVDITVTARVEHGIPGRVLHVSALQLCPGLDNVTLRGRWKLDGRSLANIAAEKRANGETLAVDRVKDVAGEMLPSPPRLEVLVMNQWLLSCKARACCWLG